MLHALGWGLFLYYHDQFGATYAAAGALAYSFGLRHAFDADHISAIDDTPRLLVPADNKPLGVGFFFSLGHSTVVFLLSFAVAMVARPLAERLTSLQEAGGVIAAMVSGTFLWVVGVLNLVVFFGILKLWRQMRQGRHDPQELEDLLLQRGFMNRLLGGRFRRFVSNSWQMYFVGLIFALGFDTASEIGLLAVSAATATATDTAGRGQIPLLGVLALPLLFAGGMSLMDTADGAFMVKAYAWAFSNPLRKVYYNLTTTALSAFVALVIGTIEYGQVISTKLGLDGPVAASLNGLDFETVGYGIVLVFLFWWVGSVALFKIRRVDERCSEVPTDRW